MDLVGLKSQLYQHIKSFSYGRNLAREALDTVFRIPDTKQSAKRSSASSLSLFFRKCSSWSAFEWENVSNWKEFRDELGKIVAPKSFKNFNLHGSKLCGYRAGALGKETLSFVKKRSESWKGEMIKSASTKVEVQRCIDLLEMVIKDSLVDASIRKDWIAQLARLCRKHRKMPKALEIDGLTFSKNSRDAFDCGGSADIFLAELDKRKVVVKVLRMDKAIRAKMKRKEWGPLHDEALNWIGLDYPGLNPFLGITLKHPRSDFGIGLVFKFQELGNSVKYLERHRIDRVDFVQAKGFYFIGAVHFLHQMGLIHGDIKGCNILIDENRDPVLTDFGLMLRTLLQSPSATPMSITASSNASSAGSLAGDYTLRFASKERVFDGMRTEEDEIWAIGMTLIELLTGEPPFSARYKNDLLFFSALTRVQIELERSDLPASVPDDLFQAIKRCISSNIAERPSAFELFTIMGKVAGNRALEGVMSEGFS